MIGLLEFLQNDKVLGFYFLVFNQFKKMFYLISRMELELETNVKLYTLNVILTDPPRTDNCAIGLETLI